MAGDPSDQDVRILLVTATERTFYLFLLHRFIKALWTERMNGLARYVEASKEVPFGPSFPLRRSEQLDERSHTWTHVVNLRG